MGQLNERFFILTPTPTGRTAKHPFGNDCQVYLDADGKEMLWSASFPIPAIGDRVKITMNGIGPGVVKGYFVSVMTQALKPPKWLRDQRKRDLQAHKRGERRLPNWQLEGIGCEFGTEVQPL